MAARFGAAALDQIAGFRNDALHQFQNVAQAGLMIDEFGDRLTQSGIGLDLARGAKRAYRGSMLDCAWGHATMLHLSERKSKGYLVASACLDRKSTRLNSSH